MTNPLITALNRITQQEARMDDEANDRREGYADGLARKPFTRADKFWVEGWDDGWRDAAMLSAVAEWKRRASLPVQG